MTRPEVRAAVEAAIRRHRAGRSAAPAAEAPGPAAPSAGADDAGRRADPRRAPETELDPAAPLNDPGHRRFPRAVLAGDPPAGRCVIEPAVECVGSGYCRSHGH